MRRYFYILLLLLPLFACTREVSPLTLEEPVDDAPEGTVSVTFSFTVPAEDPATKLGESSELETMHLAIFGSSGYYKKYVKAEKISGPESGQRTCGGVERTVDVYRFQAEVELSNTARIIHFIGNGPSTIHVGNANEVLPSELSGEGKTGFWQMVTLPRIAAKTEKDEAGNEYYVAEGGGKYGEHPETDRYVISDETLKYFQYHLEGYDDDEKPIFSTESGIPLIRNWSKVCLKNVPGSHFTPISFAVVHVPKKGTLVPYGGITGFIPNYQDIAFDDLTDAEGLYAYKGNLPEKEDLFDETIPAATDFIDSSGKEKVKQYDPRYDKNQVEYDSTLPEEGEPAVYLYERPVPTDNMPPSFVIVYGTYLNTDDPIFFDSKGEAQGWPARGDYNPSMDYGAVTGKKTEDGLTFDEFFNGIKCYYKVDFMAGGAYYPILRNFKYQVEIKKIEARGFNTPEDAAHSAGSADVSADVNASHLADISDGTRRMAVQPWMAKTFIKADDPDAPAPTHLFVKFFDDINPEDGGSGINYDMTRKNAAGQDVECVTWAFIDGDHGVIKDVQIGEPVESENRDVDGWRSIQFRVQEPDMHVAKTQTLRIACMSYLRDKDTGELINPNEQPLYRDIVITLQPKQEMRVRCERESLPRQTKEAQKVTISIPDGLPRSMFPIEFIVEPENATLTASTDAGTENLPVIYGKSIIPGKKDKSAFQFKRTVTWEAYKEVQPEDVFQDESRWRSFDCHFITNCRDNKTEVWVADKDDYFLAGNDNEESHDGFTNYSSFHTPEFKTSIPCEMGGEVQVETGVYPENLGAENYFFIEAVNLSPVSATGSTVPVEVAPGSGVYSFTPSEETVVFTFHTTVDNGDVSLKFRSVDGSYVEASLEPWHFRNVGILDGIDHNNYSDVAYGHISAANEKWFLVKCLTDTKNATPQITVKNLRGVKEDSNTFSSSGNYRERWFQTEAVSGLDPEQISLTLSAVGYVEETVTAPRFKGEIHSWIIPGSDLKKLKGGDVIGKDETMHHVNGHFSLKIRSIVEEKTPTEHSSGIMLPRGGRYIFDSSIGSSNSDIFVYYAQIQYLIVDNIPQKPFDSRVEPNPDGSLYFAYPGNDNVYMWTIPWGQTAGSLEMYAPANQDIVITKMIIRGFHGVFLDSVDTGGDIGLGDDLKDGGGL